MILKVKLDEDKGALLPIRKHSTDAGADICTPRSFLLPARSSAIIRTGVHVELPPNTVGMLKSKSGLNIFHDIVGEGVIDEGFTNEIVVKLYNLGDTPRQFKRGNEIIQLVVMPVFYPEIVQADEIQGGERGDSGYGSTYPVMRFFCNPWMATERHAYAAPTVTSTVATPSGTSASTSKTGRLTSAPAAASRFWGVAGR